MIPKSKFGSGPKAMLLMTMMLMTVVLTWMPGKSAAALTSSLNDDMLQDALDEMIQDLEDRYSDFQPDDFWHPYVDGTGNENREVVRVKAVKKETLEIGSYSQWKYARLGLKHYLIGISNRNLDVFAVGTDFTKIASFEHDAYEETLVALAAFTRWNEAENRVELVILTNSAVDLIGTSQSRLNLYEFKNDAIIKIRSFPLNYRVEAIEVCHVGQSSKAVLIPEDSGVEIDIYNIEVSNSTQVWFFQRIPVTRSATVVVYDSDMLDSVIAVAENNRLDVYTFDSKDALFAIYQSVEIPNSCRRLFSFTFSYKHYIGCVPEETSNAVRFVSFDYNKNEYVIEDLDSTFSNIETEEVYPIAVPDYTDQFFLLVRDVQGIMRILIYHGGKEGFVVEYICKSTNDEICTHLMLHRGVGFRQYEHSTFIFSGSDGVTDIWMITKDVVDFLSPVVEESRQLYTSFQELAKNFEEWDKSVLGIQNTLNDSIKIDEPNAIKGPWEVNSLTTSNFIPSQSKSSSTPKDNDIIREFYFLGTDWNDEDFRTTLGEIEQNIFELKTSISKFNLQISDAVLLNNGSQVVTAPQTVTGNFEAQVLNVINSKLRSLADTTDTKSFFETLLLQSKDLKIDGTLKFASILNVSQLNVSQLNDVNVSNIARYSKENRFRCPVQFNDGISVEGNVVVPTVNGIVLSEEIMICTDISDVNFVDGFVIENNTDSFGQYSFDKVMLRSSEQVVSSHITFSEMETTTPLNLGNVNGYDFSEFIKSVITPEFSDVIYGRKFMPAEVSTGTLKIGSTWNNRSFPNDFIRNKQTKLVLRGEKAFSTINANKVVVMGYLDGKNVNDFISRNSQLQINATWTFSGPVTIIKDMPVDGLVDGVDLDQLSHKGTLDQHRDGYVAYGDVEFEQDITVSDLTVLSNVNGEQFEEAFGDLLVFNNTRCFIPGMTIVKSNIVTDSLHVESGVVNQKHISNFLTANGDQNITVDVTLSGKCQFNRLHALQKFDGMDLNNILENAVRLTGTNKIDWAMDFENIKCGESMMVQGIINGNENLRDTVAVTSGKPSQTFYGDLFFQNFSSNNAEIMDIHLPSGSRIGGVDIMEWYNKRRRLSNDELFGDSVVIIGYVKSTGDIVTSDINGISLDRLVNDTFRSDLTHHTFTEECILRNPVVINNGIVTFDEEVSPGYSLNRLISEGFSVNDSEYETDLQLYGNWHFEHIVVTNDLDVDGLTCGVDLKELEYDAVKKGQPNLRIHGIKQFLDIEVQNSLDTSSINQKNLEDIFTLHGNQSINCPFHSSKNIKIEGLLETDGQFPTRQISERYSNEDENIHVIEGDYASDHDLTMKNLRVQGTIQSVNLVEHLDKLLTVDSTQLRFTDIKTFTSPVKIGANSGASSYNGLDLSYLELIRLDEDMTLNYPVRFLGPVQAKELYVYGSNIRADKIKDIDLEDIVNNSIKKEDALNLNNLTFDSIVVNGNLFADNFQGHPSTEFISQRGDEGIGNLIVKKLEIKGRHFIVNGLVNGYNLTKELKRTAMKSDPYFDLKGNKTFLGTIIVKEDMSCFGPDFANQVVDITKPFNITNPIEFKKPVYIDQSFNVTKPIRGHTVDSIIAEALTKDDDQPISGQWEFTKGVTFKDDVEMPGELKNFDLKGLLDEKDYEIRAAKSRIEKQKLKYREECIKVHNATEELISNPMKLDAFDKHQSITLQKQVESVITVKSSDKMFLLTTSSSCEVTRYEWENTTELFYKDIFAGQHNLRLGRIKEWQSTTHGSLGLLIYQTIASDCSTVQPGMHFIVLDESGQFSFVNLIIQEPVKAFRVISDPYGRKTALFIITGDDMLKVFKWGDEDQPEQRGFQAWSVFTLTKKYDRIDATPSYNGIGLVLSADSYVTILNYGWKSESISEVAEGAFLTSPQARPAIFESYNILYALVPHKGVQAAETQLSSTVQLFAGIDGELAKIHQLPLHDVISKAVINFAGRIYVTFLSKSFGLNIYGFKGLSGLQLLNENPIKIFNAIEVINFEVKVWEYSTPRPFIMVLTKSSIEIFHSNVYGDSLDHKSKNLCRIK